jgi:replicative DNA helicase
MMCDVPVKIDTIVRWNKDYKEKNPDVNIINIVDHSRLVSNDPKKYTKEEEKITDLYVQSVGLANEYKSSFVILSQLNRNIESSDRIRNNGSSLLPWPVPLGSDLFGADGATQCAHKIHILLKPWDFCRRDVVDYNGNELILKNHKEKWEVIMNYVVKSRFGPTGDIIYKTNLGVNRIEEYGAGNSNQ